MLVLEQFGFRSSLSTDIAIFKLPESVYKAWNHKKCTECVFCDLSRAFGCVAYDLLIQKLEFYGVWGVYLNWFYSYQNYRKQRVELKSSNSNNFLSLGTVKHAVPQGSILGNLLFSLYVNDFLILIRKNVDVIMFADDASLLFKSNSQDEIIKKFDSVLTHALKWFQANRLFLNPTKTKVLQFTLSKLPAVFDLKFAGQTLLEVDAIRFLGLQLDKQITWRNHFHFLLNKLSSACFVLRRLHDVLNIDALKLVYFAYYQCTVKYGIVFWGNSHNLNKVFLLPERMVRIMLGLGYRSLCRIWFKKYDVLTVPCLYILHCPCL
jgi:hypothetical protein